MLVEPKERVGLAVPEASCAAAEAAACGSKAFGEPVKTLRSAAIPCCCGKPSVLSAVQPVTAS